MTAAYCSGMSNFGALYAAPCGWAGDADDATYILDERRCPRCGGVIRAGTLAPGNDPAGAPPRPLGELLAMVDETHAAYWTAGGVEWRAVHDVGAGPRVLFQAHDRREGRWITQHTLEAFFGAPARIEAVA